MADNATGPRPAKSLEVPLEKGGTRPMILGIKLPVAVELRIAVTVRLG